MITRKKRWVALFAISAILLSVPELSADTVTVNIFPSSVYSSNTAAMNTAVGVSGDLVDTFDSTTLLSGLTITLSGGVSTTTYSSLPALFNGTAFSTFTANQAWDSTDTYTVTNATGSLPNSPTSPTNIANLITFNYAAGTTQFGIGLSNFQSASPVGGDPFPLTQHDLIVNGVDLGTIESLAGSNWTPGLTRNGYLVIDDTGGSITSVGFENVNQPPAQQDFLMFGDLAIAPAAATATPEPPALVLMLIALGALGLMSLMRRRPDLSC
jgi:hypothetical protein